MNLTIKLSLPEYVRLTTEPEVDCVRKFADNVVLSTEPARLVMTETVVDRGTILDGTIVLIAVVEEELKVEDPIYVVNGTILV